MAQETQSILIDDIDGSPAANTVRFALDGVQYDIIDLSETHARKLRDSLEPWTNGARRTGVRRSAARGADTTGKSTSNAAKVRQWAREHGHTVPDRGCIPTAVREAYASAH